MFSPPILDAELHRPRRPHLHGDTGATRRTSRIPKRPPPKGVEADDAELDKELEAGKPGEWEVPIKPTRKSAPKTARATGKPLKYGHPDVLVDDKGNPL